MLCNDAEFTSILAVRFTMTDYGEDNCNVDGINCNIDGDGDFQSSSGNVSSATKDGASKVTVLPGTQITPYDIITATVRREASESSILPSDIAVAGIPQDHEMWICQSMFADWGILCLHEFQIRVIHKIAFHRDQLIYIIAKTGSGKSLISLTLVPFRGGHSYTLTLVSLVRLGSDQAAKSSNKIYKIKSYHLDKHQGIGGNFL